ncbi:MAG: O-antigen ligase family protein [Aquabacterium sp.]
MKRQFYDVTPDLAGGAMLHRNRAVVSSFLFWFSFGLAWICVAFPPFRYLSYGVPFFVLLAVIIDGGGVIKDELWPFMIVLGIGLMFGPVTKTEGWKDMLFMVAGISVAFMKQLPKVRMWLIFWAWTVAFVFLYGVLAGRFSQGFHFSLSSSDSSFEGNFGFMFPMLVPFALWHRKYLLAFLSAVLAVLTLKRIALLAMLASAFFVLLGERRGRWLLNIPVMLALNVVVLVLDFMYVLGQFDTLIFKYTGQSANQLGMGRKVLHQFVVEDLMNQPWQSLIGRGLGSVYLLAEQGFGMFTRMNLHSDLLKLCYEIGYIGTIAVLCSMYSSKHYMTRVGFLFLNVLFFTDNTLIYYFFLFFFMLLMRLERENRLEA